VAREESLQFHVTNVQVISKINQKNPYQVMLAEVKEQTELGRVLTLMGRKVLMKEKWKTALRVFARVLRAVVLNDRDVIQRDVDPSPNEVELAKKILFAASAPSARTALEKGELLTLGGKLIDHEVWIDPRISRERLAILLGVGALRIIMAEEPLAVIITRAAHMEDHRRNNKDVVARVRRQVWVPRGTKLAKKMVDSCPLCRLRDRKTNGQIMGRLPDFRVTSSAPFVNTSLDMFGPFQVKDVAKGRRRFKCWGVVFACLTTKATCLMACPGYDAGTFVTTFRAFVAVYGPPSVVYCDHTRSLIKAADDLD
jgi:hypothetical protein